VQISGTFVPVGPRRFRRRFRFSRFIIIIIIIISEFDKGGSVALLLQDHLTMSPCRVIQQEMILKTGKFSVPAEMRRSTKQPGLAAAATP